MCRSRALAAAGYHVFRLDLSGLGDSDAPRGQQASVTQDLRLALDSLDTRVAGTGYALVGLCSGAHDGFQLALADARVTALFCIDGYTYPTPRFARLRWRGRLAHPLRSLGRVLKRLRGPAADAPPGLEVELTAWPSQQQAAEGYRQLLVRGTALGFVFTGDVQASYLYEAQHIEAFPFLAGAAAVWYLPHTDHTLTRRKAREELIALLRGWLSGAPQGQ